MGRKAFTNTSHFPDVNVWVALSHERHPHYAITGRWINSLGPDHSLYFCRFTQISLLRLLTTSSAMGDDVMTQAEAWKVYDRFFQDKRNRFMLEPVGVEQRFRARTNRREVSNKQWADAYLAAFAEVAGLRLVTFDKALARSTTESFLLKP